MRLTSKGRFAVTALVDLAVHSRDTSGKPVSLTRISERQNISLPFLEQIFLLLKRKNIVKSVRGPLGGYLFVKNPKSVMISDVIQAVDEELKITRCNGSSYGCIPKKPNSKCLTHNLWNKLTRHILFFLSSISIDDVMTNKIDLAIIKNTYENYNKFNNHVSN